MEPIKTIAGKILLYFYTIQRRDYTNLHDFIIEFQMRHFSEDDGRSPKILHKEKDISKDLFKIAGEDDNSVYNALIYLQGKGLIEVSKTSDTVNDHFLNLTVSPEGIDIIEGIERGEEERKEFNIIFNIKLAENINIESLIKTKLDSIIKTSLL